MFRFLANLFAPASRAPNVIETIANTIRPNPEKQAVRDAAYGKQAMDQYAAEFRYLANRTWWDSFADGLNRLVRPSLAITMLLVIPLAVIFQDGVAQRISDGMSQLPAGYWTAASLILGFYFAGRMQIKAQDWAAKNGK